MLVRNLLYIAGIFTLALGFASEAKAQKYARMDAALGELKEARREIKEAGIDFGGHKEKALEATDRAITQMEKALAAVGVKSAYIPPGKEVYRTYKNYPHIRHALTELRTARIEMKEAATDFGGHKEKAIEAVDYAITQLEKAIEFAK